MYHHADRGYKRLLHKKYSVKELTESLQKLKGPLDPLAATLKETSSSYACI